MAINWLSGTGYLIVFGVIFLCIGGLVIWWVWNKNKYRFVFELYSRDMKNITTVKARIKVDESNKKFRYFTFKNNNTRLEIEEPEYFRNGKPVRLITYDTTGDYIYIKGAGVDDSDYLKYALKPTHKTLYLQGLKDFANKYPMFNKNIALAFGALIIIGIFLVIGFVYTFASNVKQGQQLTDLAKANSQVVDKLGGIADTFVVSSNNIYQAVNLMYNGTIQRPLGGIS